jgi:hypothetical protein
MSTSTFGKATQKFISAGIHPKWLLPIAPVGAQIGHNAVISENVLGKVPGRFNTRSNTWSGLGGRYITEGISKADFEEFKEWPTGNVGLIGRAYPAIDSDAMNDDARYLIEECIYICFGKDAKIGERIRGSNSRALYAFRCADPSNPDKWVRTRHITYRVGSDASEHKLDIIGYGGQYLVAGIHQSGDEYTWHPEADITKLAKELVTIDNVDIERFIDIFSRTLQKRNGEVVRSSGGGNKGEELDIRNLDPVMPVEAVLEGLRQIPNSPDTFLHRDDFVSALAAVRAALGKESLNRETENAIFEWATQDSEWCDEAYFDKIWRSLDRVRVGRDSLDRLFRRNGVNSHIKHAFDSDTRVLSREIKKRKNQQTDTKSVLLDTVASRYLFGYVNTRESQTKVTMRDRWNVDREWLALDWWKMETLECDKQLVGDIQEIDGYSVNKVGLANFLRDVHDMHPEVFYAGEGRHPSFDKGEIIEEPQPDGNVRRLVNMRFLSPAIRHARKPDPDPIRSQNDVRHILNFIDRLFGPEMAKYELDTLAYMAQTNDRPGSMLFLVGDTGVGKSIWMNMQMALFDGIGPEQSGILDGSKLHNESARRFMFGKVEGCRVLSIRELPEGTTAREMAAITSQFKQLVDPGPEGDYVTVEAKGQDPRPARNFARVVISSNYANAINVEQYDRRIFYVQTRITHENKPDPEFYDKLVTITQDPSRLAALWRYLLGRDTGDYSRYSPPPISTEKAERIVATIEQPHIRHVKAALELFRVCNRAMFDMDELANTMTQMSEAEHLNTGGEAPRIFYSRNGDDGTKPKPEFLTAIKTIRRSEAVKLDRDLRTSKVRYPTVYVMAPHYNIIDKLLMLDVMDIVEEMDNEAVAHPLTVPHPWKLYRKPESTQ